MKAKHELERVTTYVGADGRQIRLQVKDEDGNAYDLSGFSSCTVSARLGSGSSATWKIQAKSVTIEAGTDGWVHFTPSASEIDTEGEYLAQFRFVDAGSLVDYTDPFIIDVVSAIHYTP